MTNNYDLPLGHSTNSFPRQTLSHCMPVGLDVEQACVGVCGL